MAMSDLIQKAKQPLPARTYEGDEEHPLCTRVPLSFLRDFDAICNYTSVPRAGLLRSILYDLLPSIYADCLAAGPNSSGLTVDSCRPRYYEDLSLSEQAEVDHFLQGGD